MNTATFAAIGLVAVLAGTTNTPIAASVISVELWASCRAYAAVACVVSYVMSGHRSVYPSQVLATEKSRSIQVHRQGGDEGRADGADSSKERSWSSRGDS